MTPENRYDRRIEHFLGLAQDNYPDDQFEMAEEIVAGIIELMYCDILFFCKCKAFGDDPYLHTKALIVTPYDQHVRSEIFPKP